MEKGEDTIDFRKDLPPFRQGNKELAIRAEAAEATFLSSRIFLGHKAENALGIERCIRFDAEAQ